MTSGVQYYYFSSNPSRFHPAGPFAPATTVPVGLADSRLHRRSSSASCPQVISIISDGSPTELLRLLYLQANAHSIAKITVLLCSDFSRVDNFGQTVFVIPNWREVSDTPCQFRLATYRDMSQPISAVKSVDTILFKRF